MRISRTVFSTVQAGVPTILSGDYGIGKSTVVAKFSEFLFDRESIVRFPLVGAVPEDLIGYPEIQTRGQHRITVHCPHEKILRIQRGNCIVLFEEINRADERVQNTIAQIIDGELGQFGGRNDNVMFVGTMNPHGRGVFELNENLISRFAFFEASVSHQEEQAAILTGQYTTETQFKRLPDDWRKYETKIRGWLGAFYSHRPTAFQRLSEQDEQLTPWPNPRSREKLAIPALSAALSVGFDTPDDIYEVLKATMGAPFAVAFKEWFGAKNFPNPEEVLKTLLQGKNPRFPGGVPAFIAVYSEVLFLLENMDVQEAKKGMRAVLEYFARVQDDLPEVVSYMLFLYLSRKKILPEIPMSLARLVQRVKGIF